MDRPRRRPMTKNIRKDSIEVARLARMMIIAGKSKVYVRTGRRFISFTGIGSEITMEAKPLQAWADLSEAISCQILIRASKWVASFKLSLKDYRRHHCSTRTYAAAWDEWSQMDPNGDGLDDNDELIIGKLDEDIQGDEAVFLCLSKSSNIEIIKIEGSFDTDMIALKLLMPSS